MLSDADRARALEASSRQRMEIRDRLEAYALAQWGALGSWRDGDIDQFVELIVPRVAAAQTTVASITDAFMARVLEQEGFGPTIDPAALRGGVSPEKVYRRPADTLYTALGSGKPFDEAQKLAAARLASLVVSDLQLAQRAQGRATMTNGTARPGGYRRVLNGRENCALCLIASTQRYNVNDLMPIHPGCDCSEEPLREGENVGQVIEPARLEATHDWVESVAGTADRSGRLLDGAGTGDKDYMDLIAVREHGEFGPTLTWRRHHWTGPEDLAA